MEALRFTAPWASIRDAKILRSIVLGGEIFSNFSQQEREGILIRLQSFKGLVPSLFEVSENVKCLEAWADCLKWLVHLGPRETLSSAMEKIYTGINQSVDSALLQEDETTFKSVPANSARRVDLGYRQLCAFAMRYHREIPKKPSRSDILAKPRAMLDTARLREMADLANHLGFESSEITTLKRFPKSAGPTKLRGNERPALVTEGSGEIKKDRCGMPHVRLNKLGHLIVTWPQEDDTSMADTGEGDSTPVPRKKPQTPRRQQRQELQVQERTTNLTAATVAGDKNISTGFASDFTYEAPQTPSRAT